MADMEFKWQNQIQIKTNLDRQHHSCSPFYNAYYGIDTDCRGGGRKWRSTHDIAGWASIMTRLKMDQLWHCPHITLQWIIFQPVFRKPTCCSSKLSTKMQVYFNVLLLHTPQHFLTYGNIRSERARYYSVISDSLHVMPLFKTAIICDLPYLNRPVVGKGHLHNQNDRKKLRK